MVLSFLQNLFIENLFGISLEKRTKIRVVSAIFTDFGRDLQLNA